MGFNSSSLLVPSSDQQDEASGDTGGAADKPPVVVPISKKQLAMLKSSLPSPKKHRAQKRNEEAGVKQGGRLGVGMCDVCAPDWTVDVHESATGR
jgi:hypothetical protein